MRPALEVADIFRAHGEAYRREHVLTPGQYAAMRAIEACRTAALGGHLDVCPDCAQERPSYNSCGHRNCPKCQALDQAVWIESRKARVLPVAYFHGVFTLPHELNPLALRNPKLVYDLLFRAASEALLEVAASRLGAQPAVTLVLHTWTRDLRLHPHVHAIVSGGGLSHDGRRWVRSRKKYLLPQCVLAALLRGKMLAWLRRAFDDGRLDLAGSCETLASPERFRNFLSGLYAKDWLVYLKRAFAGPEHVIEYLGRYTHRTGISNHRLVSMDADAVRFRTKDGRLADLAPQEFIQRFLLHVLPSRFVKIRHYGLLAPSNVNTRLVVARRRLGAGKPAPTAPRTGWRELMRRLTGVDPMLCPTCRAQLVRYRLPPGREYHAAPRLQDSS